MVELTRSCWTVEWITGTWEGGRYAQIDTKKAAWAEKGVESCLTSPAMENREKC